MRLSKRHVVPADLALLYEFVNSLDARRFVRRGVRHPSADELATPSQFATWLRQRGLLVPGAVVGHEALHHAVELRHGLRAFLERPPGRRASARTRARLNAAAARFPVVVRTLATAGVTLQSASGRRAGGVSRILAEFHHAAATGRLDRLKMCLSDECQWVFYDRSRPGTRRWCSSTICGNRHKARAYRRRRRKARGR
ncbi:MAG TPA: CGNR zinc finger domain-containing protein [Vicinamibacterales bacterium]